jgi:hypothetical protein
MKPNSTMTMASCTVQPTFTANFARWPPPGIVPLASVFAAVGVAWFRQQGRDLAAFLSSAAFINRLHPRRKSSQDTHSQFGLYARVPHNATCAR